MVVDVECLVKRSTGSPHNAVDGLSFTVARGAFCVVLGPNGAGKTTCLGWLVHPYAEAGLVRLTLRFNQEQTQQHSMLPSRR